MLKCAVFLLACGPMLACSREHPRDVGRSREDDVRVEHDSQLLERKYTVAAGDTRISWEVYESTANGGVIRHDSNCGLTLGKHAPLIAKVLRKVM